MITEFDLPTCEQNLPSIAAGSDGNLWFATGTTRIGFVTPKGDAHEYDLVGHVFVGDLTSGPDGAIWFSTYNAIGRLVP
jgi:virginiamycin B lyase